MLEFIGRLHPLILHLPIGILAFAYVLELYGLYKKQSFKEVQSLVLLLAALGATVSIVTGLLLIRGGDYSGDLVSNHKWVAIALGVICWVLLFLHRSAMTRAYYTTLLSSAVMLGLTGHLGGSITHGEDFLFESSAPVVRPVIEEAILYTDVIHPIFDDKCVSCHNPSKLKGELDMTSYAQLLKGGEHGAVVTVEDPLESEIWKRLGLPMSDENHMPPEGKKQLSEDETQLLKWWLESGADSDKLAVNTKGFEFHKNLLTKFLTPPEVDIFSKVDRPDSLVIQKLQQKGIKLYPTHAGSSSVYVNFSNEKSLTTSEFKALRKIDQNVGQLNLAGSNMNDELIPVLSKFKHLRKLELQNSEVSSNGLKRLPAFHYLESLNLFNTLVDSSIVDKLLELPQLRKLYLGKTQFTEEQIQDFRLKKPRLEVIYEIDKNIFKEAALRAPIINAASDIFEDSIEVSLDLNFKDVRIRYLINDGDTMEYESPFIIKETSVIKAFAKKDGWNDSEINEQTLIKRGKTIDKVVILSKPHYRYVDIAEKVLTNQKLGSSVFSDREWVGYRASHGKIALRLEERSEVSSVSVGVLESTGSYIFYPKSVEISVSDDGSNYSKVALENYPIAEGPSNVGRKNLTFNFEPSSAKWVKVDVIAHLRNPEWHVAAGEKSWIFIDEIIIN